MKCNRYRSDEFGTTIVVERRMPKMVDVAICDYRPYVVYHRWTRSDLAAYLRALGFKRAA